jgi:hypothetical protein
MQILNKLSSKEKKLLFVFVILLIVVVTYQFGYVAYSNKAKELEDSNQILKSRLMELQQKQDNRNKYITETDTMKREIDTLISKFPAGLTQEQSTIFVTELETYAGMDVSSISFGDISMFYTTGQGVGDNNSATTDGESQETKTVEVGGFSNIAGYQMTMNLSYQTTYDGLKKCIDFINKSDSKMNISDLTAAFDNTTGNLTGTMTIVLYALDGTGKDFKNVTIDGVQLGTDNIFGTFELPVE